MKIEKLEYFWGLFEKPDCATASEADSHVIFEVSEVPDDVQQSFMNERIYELQGEFGLPGVGEPEQVDVLKITAGGKSWETQVLNRAIALFTQDNEAMRRLHRFFCILNDKVSKKPH